MKKKFLIISVTAFLALAIVGWYAFTHYYPRILDRSYGSTSPDIVKKDFRFDDVNDTHLTAARDHGIKPVSSRDNLRTKHLTKIVTCNEYKVGNLTHSIPYLTESSAHLLKEIGVRFQQELKKQGIKKHRIIITSILRTKEDISKLRKVNGNASGNSAHQHATTFDITYVRYDRQSLFGKSAKNEQLANILGKVLSELRNEGRCYIKYERKQRCFHITSRK
jgi:hypothetical protein